MRSGRRSKSIVVTGVLSFVVGGCGASERALGGSAGSSGSGGTGSSVLGGTGGLEGDGRAGQGVVAGGTAGGAGTSAAGSGVPVAGAAGAAQGTTAGASGEGGQLGTAGRAGAGTGGGALTAGAPGSGGQGGVGNQRSISFGTLLDAQTVMTAAQQLAKSLANPSSAQWQAKGDQHRKYRFAAANTDEPYRLYVPTSWDGKTSLPLAMFLHGAGNDESSYVDQNNKQMLNLAQQHGYVLVAPLGDKGAYGNFLRLAAPFGKPTEAAKLMAQVTAADERTNELSEQDVLNVLELVLAEYPIDRSSMFLFGHSMGSGGTWYIGGKYASYWKGLSPMSGPFVQQTGYPWDALRSTFIYVTEGTQAPSLDGSHLLRDWLSTNGFKAEYKEVNADHPGMVPLVLPDVFAFFNRSRTQ